MLRQARQSVLTAVEGAGRGAPATFKKKHVAASPNAWLFHGPADLNIFIMTALCTSIFGTKIDKAQANAYIFVATTLLWL